MLECAAELWSWYCSLLDVCLGLSLDVGSGLGLCPSFQFGDMFGWFGLLKLLLGELRVKLGVISKEEGEGTGE